MRGPDIKRRVRVTDVVENRERRPIESEAPQPNLHVQRTRDRRVRRNRDTIVLHRGRLEGKRDHGRVGIIGQHVIERITAGQIKFEEPTNPRPKVTMFLPPIFHSAILSGASSGV